MKSPTFKPRNTPRARSLRHTATPAERLLWRYLSGSALGAKFSRQMPLGPYFADFLCRERRLVVELDGISHDRAPDRVLRFTNADVLDNAEGVAEAIRQALVEAEA